MGNNSSSGSSDLQNDPVDGNNTLARAIARGRVYVVIRYPYAVESLESVYFNDVQFREILQDLQQRLPDFEITLDAGKIDRFCEHVTFYNSNDPNKELIRQRVLVEVLYTGVFGGINKDMIKKVVQEKIDPENYCYIDIRSEMGRYHTTSHLETLLRV